MRPVQIGSVNAALFTDNAVVMKTPKVCARTRSDSLLSSLCLDRNQVFEREEAGGPVIVFVIQLLIRVPDPVSRYPVGAVHST